MADETPSKDTLGDLLKTLLGFFGVALVSMALGAFVERRTCGKLEGDCYGNHTCDVGLTCVVYPGNEPGSCVAPGSVVQNMSTGPALDGGHR